MNYVNFIVKILQKPRQTVFNNEICATQFMVEMPKLANEKFKITFQLTIWEQFSTNVSKYFFIGDYIIIEGYISLREINFNTKQIQVSVFKIYPFLFN